MLTIQEIIKVSEESVKDAFTTMLAMEVNAKGYEKVGFGTTYSGISSIIGVAGKLKGMIMIHCPDALALEVTGTMLGLEVSEVNNDVRDAVGELSNVVSGGIKNNFPSRDGSFNISTPMVVSGKHHAVNPINGKVWLMSYFDVGAHVFQVGICLEKA